MRRSQAQGQISDNSDPILYNFCNEWLFISKASSHRNYYFLECYFFRNLEPWASHCYWPTARFTRCSESSTRSAPAFDSGDYFYIAIFWPGVAAMAETAVDHQRHSPHHRWIHSLRNGRVAVVCPATAQLVLMAAYQPYFNRQHLIYMVGAPARRPHLLSFWLLQEISYLIKLAATTSQFQKCIRNWHHCYLELVNER